MSDLDPTDWDAFRRQAHDLLDHLIDHVHGAAQGDGRVWTPMPAAVRTAIAEPLPLHPQGLGRVVDDFERLILPHGVGNLHPRFFGWVHGAGTASGILAEAAAAALNANCGGRDHAAILVERTVIGWFTDVFNLGPKAGGVLVSGTSTANLLAIAAARHLGAGGRDRQDGIAGLKLAGYASADAHSCIAKAFEVLGLGREALRLIPVDEQFRMDAGALDQAMARDVAAGVTPFVVVATVGSVNTGAIDPLPEIATLCRARNVWMHVDGAFGALAALSPTLKSRVAGLDLADSMAFDMHKWLHVPYECGAVLFKDQARQFSTFGGRPDYLKDGEALAAGAPWPADMGIELSRGFRALKVWFAVKEHGLERLGAAIAADCALAQDFATRIQASPPLRLMAPVGLNIVCCRYDAAGLTGAQGDDLNTQLVAQLQVSGIAAPSTCRIGGRLCIRIAIVNHRTRRKDMDILLDAILRIGATLQAQAQGLAG